MQSNSQKMVLALGALAAVLAGVVFGVIFMGRNKGPAEPPPASRGGLELSVNDTLPSQPAKELRCFVDGQFVGEFTLEQCAQKNGVSAQSLDVGLDASGAMVAAPTASLAPPPALPADVAPGPVAAAPVQETPAPAATPAEPAASAGPSATCLRYTGSDWRKLSDSMSLNGCVQSLFAGQCVRPGEARYGRFGDLTLRLVPGRVEQSSDNSHFRTLVEQQRRTCEIPPVH